jgi:hypothetical protein
MTHLRCPRLVCSTAVALGACLLACGGDHSAASGASADGGGARGATDSGRGGAPSDAIQPVDSGSPSSGDSAPGAEAGVDADAALPVQAGEAVVTLATDTSATSVRAMAMDATDLYWVDSADAVWKVPLAGGPAVVLANGPGGDDILSRTSVAVDSTSVYWADNVGLQLMKVALEGGTPMVVDGESIERDHIAVAGGYVYFDDPAVGGLGGAGIGKVPVSGSVPNVAVTSTGGGPFGLDATNLYFWAPLNSSSLWTWNALQLADGSITPATLSPPPAHLPAGTAVDPTNLYWVDDYVGTVMKVGLLQGGVPTTLASGRSGPYAIAVDGTTVYWVEEHNVMKVPAAGGTPTVLVPGQGGVAIAVDATSVYWLNGNAVMKASPK